MIRLRRKISSYIFIVFCLLSIVHKNHIVITSANETGNLKVQVTDNENNPLSGASILLVNPSTDDYVYEDCFFTDINGECLIEDVEVGYYKIEVYYSPERPCWPLENTFLSERFFNIVVNQTRFEFIRTNYSPPFYQQKWFQTLILTIGTSVVVTLITNKISQRGKKQEEEKNKKAERKKILKLISIELTHIASNIAEILHYKKPSNLGWDDITEKNSKIQLYSIPESPFYNTFPIETPYFDSFISGNKDFILNFEKGKLITETYQAIKDLNKKVSRYNKTVSAASNVNFFVPVELESVGDLVLELVHELKD